MARCEASIIGLQKAKNIRTAALGAAVLMFSGVFGERSSRFHPYEIVGSRNVREERAGKGNAAGETRPG